MQTSPTGGAPPGDPRAVLTYDGRIAALFGIFLLNLLLTIVTLGVFRFWAITRIRRYLWSHMRFGDTRFTYTGKGKELFIGFLLAMLILSLIFAGVAMVAGALAKSHPVLAIIPAAIGYFGVFILFGGARFSAQRYRLSRTEWRGIRGGMTGSALRYGVTWVLFLLLTIVTLYQAVPWMQVGLARRRIEASRFGSAVFQCGARGRRLYPTWLATIALYLGLIGVIAVGAFAIQGSAWVREYGVLLKGPTAGATIARLAPFIIAGILAIVIVGGLVSAWYYAKFVRLILGTTSAVVPDGRGDDVVRFSSTVRAGSLLWLMVSNLLIVVFTLGLGMPVVLHRYAKYIARTTLMSGTFDAAALTQSTLARPGFGEGFLQALDPGIV